MRQTLELGHRLVQSRIKQVQYVTVAIAAGATTGTASISQVDPDNTLIFYNGDVGNDDATNPWSQLFARVDISSPVLVQAVRQTLDDVYGTTVEAVVVEFHQGVLRSVQRGLFVGPTVTVSAVDPGRATLNSLGFVYTGASAITSLASQRPRMTLTNATTLSGANGTMGYQLAEWE